MSGSNARLSRRVTLLARSSCSFCLDGVLVSRFTRLPYTLIFTKHVVPTMGCKVAKSTGKRTQTGA